MNKKEGTREGIKELFTLKKYLRKHRSGILLGFIFVCLTNAFSLLIPWILKYAIDGFKAGITHNKLLQYALLLLLVTCIQGVFRFFMRMRLIGISRRIEYELRNDLFRHLESLSPSFFSQWKIGEIMSRATNDLNAVRMVLGPGIMNFFNTIILSIAAISLMLSINARLTLYAMIPLPVLSILIKYFSAILHRRYEKVQAYYAQMSSKVQENISGIRVIKTYNQENNEIQAFREMNNNYVVRNMSMVKIWGLFFPFMLFMAGLGMLVVLWFGGKEVIGGIISLGEFVAFTGYLMMLVWPMMAFGWVLSLIQRGAASMKRINQIFESKPEITSSRKPAKIRDIKGDIEFNGVYFAYNGKQVLKDINLKIDRGTKLGIIGPVGCGKTSLINLLPRFYDVSQGEILIDGINIKKISLALLRSNIGYVPQDSFLFSDTIKNNIGFGLGKVSIEQVIEAATISRFNQEVYDFPDKYESMMGERGITLSGGQKQRTALARAIIIEPRILILDDAFSSVDTRTEEEILSELKNIFKNRTVLIVSQRISTIMEADHIIVLDEGRIVEQGTHKELLDNQGIYYRIYKEQLLTEELEEY
jgi:ATP-binding cassette subfamily B multidrug efflux pump